MLRPLFLRFLTVLHSTIAYLPTSISSRIQATLCLLHVGLGLNVSHPLQTHTIHLSLTSKNLETIVVVTKNVPTTPTTRTVLVIHGLAATGHKDPRIIQLANAIASAQPDAKVLVPYLPPLAECKLADDPVALIEEIIRLVANDHQLCPTGKVDIASACISAGMGLVAGSRVEGAIGSVLCIGTHASAFNVLQHCLEREGKDDSRYAINSVLGSFLEPRGGLNELLIAYTLDDHYQNIGLPAEELGKKKKQFPEETKLYDRLHDDGEYLKQVIAKVEKEQKDTFRAMSPMECLDDIECENLVLIHAVTDDVVPNSESVVLQQALSKRDDMKIRLCVTPLLNHGDQRAIGLSDIPKIFPLINAFAGFFLPPKAKLKSKTA